MGTLSRRWVFGPALAAGLFLGVPADAARLHGAADAGPAAADETVGFEVFLPSRDPDGFARLLAAQQDPASAEFHHWLTPETFRARFGPDAAASAGVRSALETAGFAVEDTLHGLKASGPAGAVTRLLGAHLRHVTTPKGRDRLVAGEALALPPALAAAGARIVAFDSFVRMRSLARRAARADNRAGPEGPYWAADFRQAYKAPSYKIANGAGRTIGILMDADVLDSDMTTYFTKTGVTPPTVTRVEIDGGAGFDISGDSIESTLDIQQSFGMAPGVSIILYVLKDLSDQSIMDGLNQAISDNQADIISMSFGSCEATYTAADNDGTDYTPLLGEYETIFESGNLLGITFVAASGDLGALGCPESAYFSGLPGTYSYVQSASSPATAPAVTAVGGTNLVTDYTAGSKDSTYVRENAKADPLKNQTDPYGLGGGGVVTGGYWGSGGGPSIYYAAPAWQALVSTGTAMRATPDLSLHMGGCPEDAIATCLTKVRSGDVEWLNGAKTYVIGTSASAPAFAGVLAIEEELAGGRLGNVNQTIYQLANAQQAGGMTVFHQAIVGFNGVFTSANDGSTPYNMVIGNGTMSIRNFVGAHGLKPAGIPGTGSNP
jgi:subtilase family serine protease